MIEVMQIYLMVNNYFGLHYEIYYGQLDTAIRNSIYITVLSTNSKDSETCIEESHVGHTNGNSHCITVDSINLLKCQ